MLKLGITGAAGRMGAALSDVINQDDTVELTLKFTNDDYKKADYKKVGYKKKIGNINNNNIDILIDFSAPDAIQDYLQTCIEFKIPMVIGTTGFSSQQKKQIKDAAKKIPIVFAANMSLGINLCYLLLETTAKVLDTWQVSISDIHHKNKKDSPSGTALELGSVIKNYNSEIQYSSIRSGDIAGEHTVLFATEGERLEIAHKASNRVIFAKGAITAAKWLIDQKAGLYSMLDVIRLRLCHSN